MACSSDLWGGILRLGWDRLSLTGERLVVTVPFSTSSELGGVRASTWTAKNADLGTVLAYKTFP